MAVTPRVPSFSMDAPRYLFPSSVAVHTFLGILCRCVSMTLAFTLNSGSLLFLLVRSSRALFACCSLSRTTVYVVT
ncbi:MAG: hypothetical protein ACK56I_20555, partial [bacterium]